MPSPYRIIYGPSSAKGYEDTRVHEYACIVPWIVNGKTGGSLDGLLGAGMSQKATPGAMCTHRRYRHVATPMRLRTACHGDVGDADRFSPTDTLTHKVHSQHRLAQ